MSGKKTVVKKDRSPNFTVGEQRVLAAEVAKRSTIINGELSATLTNGHKILAWNQVTDCVNAVAPTPRTVDNVKIKWKHMKRITKGKCAHNKREMSRTGGGSADLKVLTDTEKIVESQIGKASLEGVGGFDTLHGMFTQESDEDFEVVYEVDVTDLSQPGPSKPVTFHNRHLPPSESPLTDEELEGRKSSGEPPKKRVRSSRSPKEDLQNNVVLHQEELNKKIAQLIGTQNQLIELKTKKMLAQERQHSEAMAIQRQIAATLDHIYDYMK